MRSSNTFLKFLTFLIALIVFGQAGHASGEAGTQHSCRLYRQERNHFFTFMNRTDANNFVDIFYIEGGTSARAQFSQPQPGIGRSVTLMRDGNEYSNNIRAKTVVIFRELRYGDFSVDTVFDDQEKIGNYYSGTCE